MSYMDKGNIEDAQVISSTIKLPNGMYPKDLLDKVENFTNEESFIATFVNKSKFTIYGGLAGGIIGFAIALFLKKGKWGGAILGIIGGTAIGYGIGKIEEKNKKITKNNSITK